MSNQAVPTNDDITLLWGKNDSDQISLLNAFSSATMTANPDAYDDARWSAMDIFGDRNVVACRTLNDMKGDHSIFLIWVADESDDRMWISSVIEYSSTKEWRTSIGSELRSCSKDYDHCVVQEIRVDWKKVESLFDAALPMV